MCGRFGLFVTPEVLEEYFSLTDLAADAPQRGAIADALEHWLAG